MAWTCGKSPWSREHGGYRHYKSLEERVSPGQEKRAVDWEHHKHVCYTKKTFSWRNILWSDSLQGGHLVGNEDLTKSIVTWIGESGGKAYKNAKTICPRATQEFSYFLQNNGNLWTFWANKGKAGTRSHLRCGRNRVRPVIVNSEQIPGCWSLYFEAQL